MKPFATLLSLGLVAVGGVVGATAPQARVRVHHLEISLAAWPGLAEGGYFLDMIPSGQITRKGDAPLGPTDLPADVRTALRRLIAKERFFELRNHYGVAIIDGPSRHVTVTLNGRRHTTVLHCLKEAEEPRAEIRRALRVWYGALEAMSDPGAVQITPADRHILAEER